MDEHKHAREEIDQFLRGIESVFENVTKLISALEELLLNKKDDEIGVLVKRILVYLKKIYQLESQEFRKERHEGELQLARAQDHQRRDLLLLERAIRKLLPAAAHGHLEKQEREIEQLIKDFLTSLKEEIANVETTVRPQKADRKLRKYGRKVLSSVRRLLRR